MSPWISIPLAAAALVAVCLMYALLQAAMTKRRLMRLFQGRTTGEALATCYAALSHFEHGRVEQAYRLGSRIGPLRGSTNLCQ